jgi:transaldolase/glucose-6-phosphate isomerase
MFRWEFAVAVAGAVLGIHPFDQPDVQLAKRLAHEAMAEDGGGSTPEITARPDELAAFLDQARPGDYVALQAFLAPTGGLAAGLAALQGRIRDRVRVPTTVGIGPRFLHSTGQLHKGGPSGGLFVQLLDRPSGDLPVPGSDFSFARLIAAQARGDARALEQRQRRVLTLDLGDDPETGVEALVAALG